MFNPFTQVTAVAFKDGSSLVMESGNPFGIRLAALRNSHDPGPFEAAAVYVPKGEVLRWRFPATITRFNVRSSCINEPGQPQIRGYTVTGGKVTDTTSKLLTEPEYDIQNLQPVQVGGTRAPIPMNLVTLGALDLASDAIFDTFKVEL